MYYSLSCNIKFCLVTRFFVLFCLIVEHHFWLCLVMSCECLVIFLCNMLIFSVVSFVLFVL
jgi:hypothetical protein